MDRRQQISSSNLKSREMTSLRRQVSSFELPSSDSEGDLDQLLLGSGRVVAPAIPHVEPAVSDVELPSDVEEA